MNELILGGARSGKSRHAEQRALDAARQDGLKVTYIATAEAAIGKADKLLKDHKGFEIEGSGFKVRISKVTDGSAASVPSAKYSPGQRRRRNGGMPAS